MRFLGGTKSSHAVSRWNKVACGFSVEQSQAYTLHSPRHFLPEVSAARGEPGTCRCEIGRWSHSVAHLPALRPETNMLRQHRERASTLPDLYARNNATQRPLTILRRQLESLRDFAVTCGPGKLPTHGGIQNLSKFKATGGPHEDSRQQVAHTSLILRKLDVKLRVPTHLGPIM